MALAERGEVGDDGVPVDTGLGSASLAHHLEVAPGFFEARGEGGGPQEVDHADAAAARFVLVGGADAPLGGADLALAATLFREALDPAVVRQDQVGAVGDHEVLLDGDALLAQHRRSRLRRRRGR